MSTYRAKKRGSIMVEGVCVPFDKGTNVTPLANEIPAGVLKHLIAESIWEDVSAEIIEAEKTMEAQLKKIANVKKAKAKK